MEPRQSTWVDRIIKSNKEFRNRINPDHYPPQREPCPYAVITCMDPRVNLESIGVPPFAHDGKLQSQVRVIRTIGAMADMRSLVIGIHLAGFREVAILMHTDCGCSLAFTKIDTILENLRNKLDESRYQSFRDSIGEPFKEKLIDWLKAFEDPYQTVRQEIDRLKQQPLVPSGFIIHGLVYDLNSGEVEVVVNGYASG